MDEDGKKWWQSKTLWGVVISVGGKLAAVFHYELSAEAEAGLVELALLATSLVGDALAWYGRYFATKTIAPK